jgi:enolase-phosphatase E1
VIRASVRAILLDVEGTTSSIRFVYDEMFPYVRLNLDEYLETHWNDDGLRACLLLLAAEIGQPSVEQWLDGDDESNRRRVAGAVLRLMDDDVKATGLKQLQGMIWKDGFESGELVAHVFTDVADALRRWHALGIDLWIYSSGSIAAQKLFFSHTVAGDLLTYFHGHFDTTTGSKTDPLSYRQIAAAMCLPPNEILFISDAAGEIVAAQRAGMQVLLSERPGNPANPQDGSVASISSFDEVVI